MEQTPKVNKSVYLHDAAYARANGEIEQSTVPGKRTSTAKGRLRAPFGRTLTGCT